MKGHGAGALFIIDMIPRQIALCDDCILLKVAAYALSECAELKILVPSFEVKGPYHTWKMATKRVAYNCPIKMVSVMYLKRCYQKMCMRN